LEASYNLIDKKYDIIILLRLDIFDIKNFDFNYINTEYWDQINAGLIPHYFIGNQLLMDKLFKNIFNDVLLYFNPNSEYIKLLCEIGWPYSDLNDEFSNIILKIDNSKKLMIYSKNVIADDHLLFKYHFFRLNLLNNVCYVNEKGIIFFPINKN